MENCVAPGLDEFDVLLEVVLSFSQSTTIGVPSTIVVPSPVSGTINIQQNDWQLMGASAGRCNIVILYSIALEFHTFNES